MRNNCPVKLSYLDNYCKDTVLSAESPSSKFLDDYKFQRLVYTQHLLCQIKSYTTAIYLNNLKLTNV